LERRIQQRGAGDAVTEDDDSARSMRPVLLDGHCRGVSALARLFAAKAGMPPTLVDDVALAALLHDGGKAHPAFKRLLYGGAELAALAGPNLAKSTKLPEGPAAWQDARRRAGFPRGGRHELASLAVAEAHPLFAQAHDPALVLWLIGTHHGFGRPFFPAVDWPGSESERIDIELGGSAVSVTPARSLAELTARWLDLFAALQVRYGPWGLARLEAIVRLADHRQSEGEETGDENVGDATEAAA
jgi:CRISPR-associated endonuclease/helicase Cas3